MRTLPVTLLTLVTTLLIAGCASNKSEGNAKATPEPKAESKKEAKAHKERSYPAEPTKVRFGEFKHVALKPCTLAPKFASKKANQESAAKIDGMLQQQLKYIWPDLQGLAAGAAAPQSAERTLVIEPYIEEISIVSVGSRIMWGVMAGGSDLVMKVTYRDSANGQVVAEPYFWKGNNAWSGGTSWGAADNQIRDAIVGQIINYTRGNK